MWNWVLGLLLVALVTAPVQAAVSVVSSPPICWPEHYNGFLFREEGQFYANRGEQRIPFSNELNQALKTLASQNRLESQWNIFVPTLGYKRGVLQQISAQEEGGEITRAYGEFHFDQYDPYKDKTLTYSIHIELTRVAPQKKLVKDASLKEVIPLITPDDFVGTLSSEPLDLLSERFMVFASPAEQTIKPDSLLIPATRVGLQTEGGLQILWVRTDHLVTQIRSDRPPSSISVFGSPAAAFSKWPVEEKWVDFTLAEGAASLEPEPGRQRATFSSFKTRAKPPLQFGNVLPELFHVHIPETLSGFERLKYIQQSLAKRETADKPKSLTRMRLLTAPLDCVAQLLGWI